MQLGTIILLALVLGVIAFNYLRSLRTLTKTRTNSQGAMSNKERLTLFRSTFPYSIAFPLLVVLAINILYLGVFESYVVYPAQDFADVVRSSLSGLITFLGLVLSTMIFVIGRLSSGSRSSEISDIKLEYQRIMAKLSTIFFQFQQARESIVDGDLDQLNNFEEYLDLAEKSYHQLTTEVDQVKIHDFEPPRAYGEWFRKFQEVMNQSILVRDSYIQALESFEMASDGRNGSEISATVLSRISSDLSNLTNVLRKLSDRLDRSSLPFVLSGRQFNQLVWTAAAGILLAVFLIPFGANKLNIFAEIGFLIYIGVLTSLVTQFARFIMFLAGI